MTSLHCPSMKSESIVNIIFIVDSFSLSDNSSCSPSANLFGGMVQR